MWLLSKPFQSHLLARAESLLDLSHGTVDDMIDVSLVSASTTLIELGPPHFSCATRHVVIGVLVHAEIPPRSRAIQTRKNVFVS